MKKIVRLTEGQLYRLIEETLNEFSDQDYIDATNKAIQDDETFKYLGSERQRYIHNVLDKIPYDDNYRENYMNTIKKAGQEYPSVEDMKAFIQNSSGSNKQVNLEDDPNLKDEIQCRNELEKLIILLITTGDTHNLRRLVKSGARYEVYLETKARNFDVDLFIYDLSNGYPRYPIVSIYLRSIPRTIYRVSYNNEQVCNWAIETLKKLDFCCEPSMEIWENGVWQNPTF